jgi:hypothetical protein
MAPCSSVVGRRKDQGVDSVEWRGSIGVDPSMVFGSERLILQYDRSKIRLLRSKRRVEFEKIGLEKMGRLKGEKKKKNLEQ